MKYRKVRLVADPAPLQKLFDLPFVSLVYGFEQAAPVI